MRDGYYSDAYFNYTRRLLATTVAARASLMQVFQRKQAMLGGMDEAIAILASARALRPDGSGARLGDRVHALYDGDEIEPWETVMTIEGDYALFAHLETVVPRHARAPHADRDERARGRAAAHGKPIIYFPARHDHHRVQTGDGYAAHVAGAIGVSTDAQASWWGGRGIGTVPHGLIAAYGGDTVLAATQFAEWAPERLRTSSCSSTSTTTRSHRARRRAGARPAALGRAARHLEHSWSTARSGRRWAASTRAASTRSSSATCATRSTADGFEHVRIVASGGFTVDKIEAFEAAGCPSTPTASARR